MVDSYSDLDFEVVVQPGSDLNAMQRWVSETIGMVAPLLAHFRATHIGLNSLLIFFFEKSGGVVKVDVAVLDLESFANHPDATIIHDPGGFLAAFRATEAVSCTSTSSSLPDFEDLHHKLCGWIWYTYTKIARGECLEAIDSLDCMRSYALLPCLQLIEDLPREGYRRMENRLSPDYLSSLQRTLPSSINRHELLRSLIAITQLFSEVQPLVAKKLGQDHCTANLEGMIQIVNQLGLEDTDDRA